MNRNNKLLKQMPIDICSAENGSESIINKIIDSVPPVVPQESNELLIMERINNRVRSLCNNYKPFIKLQYHYMFDVTTSMNIEYTNYLIFAIWFCSKLNIPINDIEFKLLYPLLKHIPFHSFLYNIKCQSNITKVTMDY